jgi:hypothetical protein
MPGFRELAGIHDAGGQADDRTLTANIRQRRGSLVDIRLPLFIDENTPLPEGTQASLSNGHAGEPETSIAVRCG